MVLQQRPLRAPTAGVRRLWSVLGVVALGALLVATARFDLTSATIWRGGFLACSLLAVILIVTVLQHAGPVAWLMGSRPLARRRPHVLRPLPVPLAHLPLARREPHPPRNLAALALRLAVTAGITAASYHLLEMPIRNRSLRVTPAHLRWIAAGCLAVITTGAFVATTRNAPNPFGGLDTAVGAAPVTHDDHRLDVLVVSEHPDATARAGTAGPRRATTTGSP